MDLYLYSFYMLSWCGQGKLHPFSSTSLFRISEYRIYKLDFSNKYLILQGMRYCHSFCKMRCYHILILSSLIPIIKTASKKPSQVKNSNKLQNMYM